MWCLRAPANEAQLAAASAALGVLERSAAAMSRATTARRTHAGTTAARDGSGDAFGRLERRVRSVDRQSRPSEETSPAAAGDAAGDVYTRGGRLRLLPRSGSGRQKSWPTTFHQETSVSASVSAPGPRRARRLRRRPRSGSSRARATRAMRWDRLAGTPARAATTSASPFPVMVDGVVDRRGDREDAAPRGALRRGRAGRTPAAPRRRRRRWSASPAKKTARSECFYETKRARRRWRRRHVHRGLREADRALSRTPEGDDLGGRSARARPRGPRAGSSRKTRPRPRRRRLPRRRGGRPGPERDPPPRVKTRPEDGETPRRRRQSSPSSPSGSGISAPESPRATGDKTRASPRTLNPWWMRLVAPRGLRARALEQAGERRARDAYSFRRAP